MTALRVLEPGLQTTVQDLGRFGHQRFGVPVSGALDAEALAIANALVGNRPGEAALEIRYLGPVLEVEADRVRVALVGGAGLVVEDREVPALRSVTLTRGQRLRVPPLRTVATGYLAIEGGLALEPVLGSRSTHPKAGLGGLDGRALRPGDMLPLGGDATDRSDLMLRDPPELGPPASVRVVLGPQDDHFTDEAVQAFLDTEWRVSPDADRWGLRLDGGKLQHRGGWDIVSDGIATGAVQVPGSGQPILLLADHQTAGGYPKIAVVASVDLPAVGRLRVGDGVRFRAVAVEEAEALRRRRETELAALLARLEPARDAPGLDERALHGENLVSGVVDALE
jgi:biotin-dependent carboxylase-like uncharacterized protein